MVVWHWSPGCMLIFFAKRSTIFVDNKIKEVEQRNHCLALISSLHVDFLCCHQFGCQWFSVNQLPVKKCEPGIKLWFEKASAISSPWPPCQPPYHFHIMPPLPCPSPPTPHCQPPRRLPRPVLCTCLLAITSHITTFTLNFLIRTLGEGARDVYASKTTFADRILISCASCAVFPQKRLLAQWVGEISCSTMIENAFNAHPVHIGAICGA